MNDFVKIQKQVTAENPDFSACREYGFQSNGEKFSVRKYYLRNKHRDIKININEASGLLTVEGNMGFYQNGHNIDLSFTDLRNAINKISDQIKVDLFPAIVEEFDHSAIVQTNLPAKLIIQNHLSLSGHDTKHEGNGKYFVKKGQQVVKMYDGHKRMKQVYTKAMRENIYASLNIDSKSNLIRFEKKILRPEAYFKSSLTVDDILRPDFIHQCNIDLMKTYDNITKIKTLEIPKNKKQLTAATLTLIVAKELELILNIDFNDMLNKRISSIDNSILSKDDKKARKRQIKANLNKISGKVVNEYDISDQLAESLKMIPGSHR